MDLNRNKWAIVAALGVLLSLGIVGGTAVGASNDGGSVGDIEERVVTLEQQVAELQQQVNQLQVALADETTARQQGDADTLVAVDQKDAATLASAKSYADKQDDQILAEAKTYSNDHLDSFAKGSLAMKLNKPCCDEGFPSGWSGDYAAQIFTASRSGRLTTVEMELMGNASGTLQIRTLDNDGEPRGEVIGEGTMKHSGSMWDWVTIPLTSQPDLVAGRQYAIMFPATFGAIASYTDAYKEGYVMYHTGNSWKKQSDTDINFKLWIR